MQWYDACKECPRMKMRLQIVSVLPAPAKLQPGGSNGKGMFGATFQEMMGTSGSAGAGLGVMGQAWSGRQEQMGALFTKLRAGEATDESAGEAAVTLLEINTMPGFTSTSLYPEAAGISGIPMSALCDRFQARMLAFQYAAARAGGEVLTSAARIACRHN